MGEKRQGQEAGGRAGGPEPEWYRGPFLKLTATASLIWTLGVCTVIALLRIPLLVSETLPVSYWSIAAALLGSVGLVLYHRATGKATPPSTRTRYQRYMAPLLQGSTFMLLALHLLVCSASTSTATLYTSTAAADSTSFLYVHDEAVLRLVAAAAVAVYLTLDHIYNDRSVLHFPAQQGALILRLKTSVRLSAERAHDLALNTVFFITIVHFVAVELAPHVYVGAISWAVNPLRRSDVSFRLQEVVGLLDVFAAVRLYISVAAGAASVLVARAITHTYFTHLPKSGISVSATKDLQCSLDSRAAHVRRLAMSLLLTSLRQRPAYAKEFFHVDAAGESQWRVVSRSCMRITREFIVAISPGALTGLPASNGAAATTSAKEQGRVRNATAAGSDIPSIPSTGPMPAPHHRQVTVLDRLLLWLKRVYLQLRLERAWFQPYLTQQDASYLLRGQRDGMFVVHASDVPGCLALTVVHDALGPPRRHAGHTWTGYITVADSKFALNGREETQNFFSIEELVRYYSQNPYTISFVGEKQFLAPYHKDRVLRAALRAVVGAVSTLARRLAARTPGVNLLLQAPPTDALHTHLVGADGVCAALEVVACSFERAATMDKHTRSRVAGELGPWVSLLSRLFLTVAHLEEPLRADDRSTVDHANHRRVRTCVPSRSSALMGLKHAVITCAGRLFREFPKEAAVLAHEADASLLAHVPHLDLQHTPHRPAAQHLI